MRQDILDIVARKTESRVEENKGFTDIPMYEDPRDVIDMNFIIALLLLWLLNYSSAQNGDCDFYQNIHAGQTYYVNSPNYPDSYPRGVTCRWMLECPTGYNCRLDCPEISLPQSSSCSLDRFMVSRTGDLQLNETENYCGVTAVSSTSTGSRMSLGLVISQYSTGGRFSCQVTAQSDSATLRQSCSCGEREGVDWRETRRIVGGQETGVNEYKMMVGLKDLRIYQIKCGGVIISNIYVLTAAHCVRGESTGSFAVIVGEHDVTIDYESPATREYAIARFTIHPWFTDSNYDYDIAIVTVAFPIEFNDRVGPVCLPFKYQNTDFAGAKVTILGWGNLFFGGPSAKVLMKVDVDVLSQNTCRARIPSLTDRQMCTFTRGKDACQDDSGGPALFTDPTTGRLFCVGIISYGSSCASLVPEQYARVTALLDWITANAPSNYCVK